MNQRLIMDDVQRLNPTSRRARPVAGLLLVAALTGCTVGPDYMETKAVVPGQFSEVGEGGTSAAAPDPATLARWWRIFNDATLNSLVDRAIAGNLDLRVAEARVREARAQRGVVAADGLPQVDAVGKYARERQSGTINSFPGRILERDFYQLGFDATWEIDVFGRVRRGVEAADARISSEIENRRDVLVSLLSEVARNYVEVRTFQRRYALTSDNLRTQREGVGLSRTRFDAGLTSELDVKQAESLAASTEAQLPTLETGELFAIHRLGTLLGLAPGQLLTELRAVAPIPTRPPEIAVGIPSDLLRRRPDIRRAERTLAAATADIGVATADLYPRFSITGTFGFSSDEVGDLADGASRYWSIGPAMRWNIFDAGRIRSNIAVQDARAEAAIAKFETSILTALQDVEDSLVRYSREQVRRVALSRALEASRGALDISNELYTRGLTDYLNVLDSQRAVLAAEDNLAQSDRAVAQNVISLYKALGGGWDETETDAAAEKSLRPRYEGTIAPQASATDKSTDDKPAEPSATEEAAPAEAETPAAPL